MEYGTERHGNRLGKSGRMGNVIPKPREEQCSVVLSYDVIVNANHKTSVVTEESY
jgi:hypothetical protein